MKTTATSRLKRHLLSGKPITPMQALKKFGMMRLGARIYELSRQGIAITSELVTRGGKTFARYKLIS